MRNDWPALLLALVVILAIFFASHWDIKDAEDQVIEEELRQIQFKSLQPR